MLNHVRRVAVALLGFLIAATVLAFAVPVNATQHAIDVFGRPVPPSSASATSPGASTTHYEPAASVAKSSPFSLPESIRVVIATDIIWQGELNARIADAAQHLRQDATPRTWLTLLLLSFAYGVLHSVGPGHGKLVIGTYLGSRKTLPAHAIALCCWTATVQALSAIVLVFGMTWIADAGMAGVLTQAESLEVVSYALLCLTSAWTLYTCVARGSCCFDPSALELVPKGRRMTSSSTASSINEPYLGAKRVLHGRARVCVPADASAFSQAVATGFAAGVRPCVGAIFVLIGSVAARAPSIGIAATFAMAAGVALTVTLVGLGAVGASKLLTKRLRIALRWIAASGALIIALFAAVQISLLLSGYMQPSLT
ncbi:high frequency lysogenization protein HflD [Burkholderia sp. JSH-S8]|nr:high frequency lysogenization protein HflD [Burkholderia sp. JSH-S8]